MKELDLVVGAPVSCDDGDCGKLAKVAIEPETWQVTHLIVEEGFLLKRARVFPFSIVSQDADGALCVCIGKEELSNYPIYEEHVVDRPAPGQPTANSGGLLLGSEPYGTVTIPPVPMVRETVRHGISTRLAVLGQGVPIMCPEGQIGKLDHLLADPVMGQLTGVVMQQGTLFPDRWLLPAYLVEHIDEQNISVAVTDEEAQELRRYERNH